ncbi:MAG: LacI family DNA-binding transcriptional regulator [Verrucomicrobiota bacterium JB024]|nr:LacI family DNA-binding transcriptional regulator [Verrucomicrobiota bacterium JB024]
MTARPRSDSRAPTLADVGKLAGVSATTASYALRNDARVLAATQQKVRAAAAQLGYTPDPVLSALVARRDLNRKHAVGTNLAALVDDRWQDNIRAGWFHAFLDGMERACRRLGYALDVMRISRDLEASNRPDSILHGRGIRGIVLLPLFSPTLSLRLNWDRYSVIAVGAPPKELPFHRVGSAAFHAVQIICDKLKQLGYRRIGLAHPLMAEKRLGYEWLGGLSKEIFLPDSQLEIVPPCLPDAFTPERFLAWVEEHRPEVVITNSPLILDWLKQAKYRVPRDIGVALVSRDTTDVEAAGLAQHLDISGEMAIEQLHLLLLRGETGFPLSPKETLVRPHWVDGPTLRKHKARRAAKRR